MPESIIASCVQLHESLFGTIRVPYTDIQCDGRSVRVFEDMRGTPKEIKVLYLDSAPVNALMV